MAAVASLNSRIFVGSLGWHAYATGFNFTESTAMLDVTTLANTSNVFIPGIDSGDLSVESILDTATATNFAASTTWKGTPQVVTLLHAGTARGTACVQVIGNQGSFTINSSPSDAVKATGSIMTSDAVDFGLVIDPETAITADTNGTAVDNGASTANGGAAHLHVTAFSGLSSNSVIVEHSTDNVSFATLGTFTLVSGTTSERLTIAAGTTVNRYVRVRDDVTGTGSCTRIVTFARR
jgi:hypothetical protein